MPKINYKYRWLFTSLVQNLNINPSRWNLRCSVVDLRWLAFQIKLYLITAKLVLVNNFVIVLPGSALFPRIVANILNFDFSYRHTGSCAHCTINILCSIKYSLFSLFVSWKFPPPAFRVHAQIHLLNTVKVILAYTIEILFSVSLKGLPLFNV